MKNIGFGIIGSGSAAKYHINALAEAAGAELIGIYSVDKKSAEITANENGVRCFDSIDDLLGCPEVEAVSICTPNGTHADIAERLLRAGKHVLVEKPLAMTDDDCRRVCLAAKESGKICAVISQLRFFEATQKIKQGIKDSSLGRIISVSAYMKYYRSPEYYAAADWRGTWASDGGLLMNQGIHGIDLLRYFVGEVSAVSAVSRTLLHKIEADDTTAALLEFENGAIGVIEGTTSVYPGYDLAIEICGTDGSIRIEGSKIVRWDSRNPSEKLSDSENTVGSGADPDAISYIGHKLQIENMVASIRGSEALISDCESGRRTVSLINAIYLAAKENKRIILDQQKG